MENWVYFKTPKIKIRSLLMKNWLRILILCCVCIFTTFTFVACDFSINAAGKDTENPNSNITVPEPETPTSPVIPSDPLPEEPSIPEPVIPTPCQHENYGQWEIVIPATCTTTGIQQRICIDCNDIEEQIIPANGHKHIENFIDATCGRAGSKTITCENCDYNEVVTIPATGKHKMKSQITTPATCINGVITHVCSDCGHSEAEAIPANGNHEYESSVTQPATCGTDGVKTYQCKYCDHKYTEPISATGKHDFDHENPEIMINPSCNTAGQQKIVCKLCPHYYTEEIAKLDHNYINHQCEHCGEYQNPMENLVGSVWSITDGGSAKKNWSISFDSSSAYSTFYKDDADNITAKGYDGKYRFDQYENKISCEMTNIPYGVEPTFELIYALENGNHILRGKVAGKTCTFVFIGYGVL